MGRHTIIRSSVRRIAALTAAVLAGSLGSAGVASITETAAHADTSITNYVTKATDGIVHWVGGPEDNSVAVSTSGLSFKVTDSRADIAAVAPCTRIRFGEVTCPLKGVRGVRFNGQSGNDTLVGSSLNDTLIGGRGNDFLSGGSGNDDLAGNDGLDLILGGPGDDKLDAGAGGPLTDSLDYVSGGDGIDWITYLAKASGVRVSLDNRANDGIDGEQDNILSDVEDVTGTAYDDVIIGADGVDNFLFGTWGNDSLHGRGGNDSLFGELGRDSLYGEAGDDTLSQRYATATDPDVDGFSSCGAGHDTLHRDPGDSGISECEPPY